MRLLKSELKLFRLYILNRAAVVVESADALRNIQFPHNLFLLRRLRCYNWLLNPFLWQMRNDFIKEKMGKKEYKVWDYFPQTPIQCGCVSFSWGSQSITADVNVILLESFISPPPLSFFTRTSKLILILFIRSHHLIYSFASCLDPYWYLLHGCLAWGEVLSLDAFLFRRHRFGERRVLLTRRFLINLYVEFDGFSLGVDCGKDRHRVWHYGDTKNAETLTNVAYI